MTYLALARRFRPRTFDELIGQPHVVQTLNNAIAHDRVHHAFLFTGARGVGKTSAARLLARALNCVEGPTSAPCGACSLCQSIAQGQGGDVLEIDGASNTGVDHVRELRETARYLPAQARFKIYIIDEVHMLSQAAFNALLKILEEPPPHVKFILATTEPQKIPTTVLSRMQRFDFRKVGIAALSAHLTFVGEQVGANAAPEIYRAIAEEGGGSVRDSLSLLDRLISFAGEGPIDADILGLAGIVDRGAPAALVQALVAGTPDVALSRAREVAQRGCDLARLAIALCTYFRDLAVAAEVAEPSAFLPLRTEEEITQMVALARRRAITDWQRYFEMTLQLTDAIARSPIPEATFDMGLLRLFEVAPGSSIKQLLGKIDAFIKDSPDAAPDGSTQKVTADTDLLSGYQPAVRMRPSHAPQRVSLTKTPEAISEKPSVAPPVARSAPDIALPVKTKPALPPGEATPKLDGIVEQTIASAERMLDTYRATVDHVRKRRPDYATVWEQGRLLQLDKAKVHLAFAPGTFFWDAAIDPSNQALLLDGFELVLGARPKLTVSKITQEQVSLAPTLVDERVRANQQARQDLEDRIRNHAAISTALQYLGGEVLKTRAIAPN